MCVNLSSRVSTDSVSLLWILLGWWIGPTRATGCIGCGVCLYLVLRVLRVLRRVLRAPPRIPHESVKIGPPLVVVTASKRETDSVETLEERLSHTIGRMLK